MTKGKSWPMVNTGKKKPVKKESFEERMERRQMIWKGLYDPVDNKKK